VRERLDLPTVHALYRAWSDSPPAGVRLARIDAYLRGALGIKDQPRRTARRPLKAGEVEMDGEDAAWLASLPAGPMPKYLSPDEYWAMREAERPQGAKHE
jgi:hypothetical protein